MKKWSEFYTSEVEATRAKKKADFQQVDDDLAEIARLNPPLCGSQFVTEASRQSIREGLRGLRRVGLACDCGCALYTDLACLAVSPPKTNLLCPGCGAQTFAPLYAVTKAIGEAEMLAKTPWMEKR